MYEINIINDSAYMTIKKNICLRLNIKMYEMNIINDSTYMIIQNHLSSVKYQNVWTALSCERAPSVRVVP